MRMNEDASNENRENQQADQKETNPSYLQRLRHSEYRGFAVVHWALTIHERKKGWLDNVFHLRFREMLVHTGARYGVCSPIYCLMPDHLHLLWIGFRADADQRLAMKFFRTQINRVLGTASSCECFKLQKQGYDHVLRDDNERDPDGIGDVAAYIRANPVRGGLCEGSTEYPYAGCMVPGYPDLDIDDEEYWELFWRIFWIIRVEEGR